MEPFSQDRPPGPVYEGSDRDWPQISRGAQEVGICPFGYQRGNDRDKRGVPDRTSGHTPHDIRKRIPKCERQGSQLVTPPPVTATGGMSGSALCGSTQFGPRHGQQVQLDHRTQIRRRQANIRSIMSIAPAGDRQLLRRMGFQTLSTAAKHVKHSLPLDVLSFRPPETCSL